MNDNNINDLNSNNNLNQTMGNDTPNTTPVTPSVTENVTSTNIGEPVTSNNVVETSAVPVEPSTPVVESTPVMTGNADVSTPVMPSEPVMPTAPTPVTPVESSPVTPPTMVNTNDLNNIGNIPPVNTPNETAGIPNSAEQPKKKHGIAIAIVIIVILVAAGIAGYFFYTNKKLTPKNVFMSIVNSSISKSANTMKSLSSDLQSNIKNMNVIELNSNNDVSLTYSGETLAANLKLDYIEDKNNQVNDVKVNATYSGESLIDGEISTFNKKLYAKLKGFDNLYYDDTNEVPFISILSADTDKYDYTVFVDALVSTLDENLTDADFTTEATTTDIYGTTTNVNKYQIDLTKDLKTKLTNAYFDKIETNTTALAVVANASSCTNDEAKQKMEDYRKKVLDEITGTTTIIFDLDSKNNFVFGSINGASDTIKVTTTSDKTDIVYYASDDDKTYEAIITKSGDTNNYELKENNTTELTGTYSIKDSQITFSAKYDGTSPISLNGTITIGSNNVNINVNGTYSSYTFNLTSTNDFSEGSAVDTTKYASALSMNSMTENDALIISNSLLYQLILGSSSKSYTPSYSSTTLY